MANPSPTPRQLDALRFIAKRVRAGLPPTYADLSLGLGGIQRQAVADLLAGLERKGHIRREPRIARGIRVTRRGRTALRTRRSS